MGSEETRQLEAWANAVSTFIVSYTFHNRTEFSVMNSHVETLREYLAPGILVLKWQTWSPFKGDKLVRGTGAAV